MVMKPSDSFDPDQPALIVTYGSTGKRHRALNRPALVLGKARGCDIGLVAPDVSNLHCVIARTPDGFQVRDCASRTGTRLNGRAVTEALLHDGDVLQVGPFSFRVYLPPHLNPGRGAEAGKRTRRLERSRRSLARFALAYRRRLREHQARADDLVALQADLDQRLTVLRGQVQEYEQRFRQLEQAERDLAADRAALDQEAAELRARRERLNEGPDATLSRRDGPAAIATLHAERAGSGHILGRLFPDSTVP